MSGSIVIRAFLALVLMIGFYLLAFGIVAALGYLTYVDLTSDRIHIRFLIFAAVGVFGILYGILPRIDRFVAPGPELRKEDTPRLHAVLENIAAETRQTMPSEVYLIPDVNAWVAQRGGIMGFGSRRVMGLGLPLLQALSVEQLKGIVAHEFGHYHGGDTMLGPWVYKTRAAVIRTAQSLQHGHFLLQLPFILYSKMFLHISQAVSRRQELNADRLAVGIVGVENFASGLTAIAAVAPAFASYWQSDVQSVLASSLHPPIAAGFLQFLAAPNIKEQVADHLKQELREGVTDPLDSHPSLADRLEAIGALYTKNAAFEPQVRGRAIDLIDDVPNLERQLLGTLASEEFVERLQPISWDDVVQRVYVESWKTLVAEHANQLQDHTVLELPALIARWAPGKQNQDPGIMARQRAAFGAALTLSLLRAGWEVHTGPGQPIIARHAGEEADPFTQVNQLAEKKMDEAAWNDWCQKRGVALLPLFDASLSTRVAANDDETPAQPGTGTSH